LARRRPRSPSTATLIRRPATAIALTSAPSTTSPMLINMGPLQVHVDVGHFNRGETLAGHTR